MQISNETSEAILEAFEAEQEAMQQMTGKIGWRYKDLPRLTHEAFDQFVETVGKENLSWITFANYSAHGNMPATKRGQVMISPEGIARMTKVAKATHD